MTRSQARASGRAQALKIAGTGTAGDGVERNWYTDVFSDQNRAHARDNISRAFQTNANIGFDSGMTQPGAINQGDRLMERGQGFLRPASVPGSEGLPA